MKTQLLQDIDESHPNSSSLPTKADPSPVEAIPLRPRSFAEQWRQAGLSRPREAPASTPRNAGQAAPAHAPPPADAAPPAHEAPPVHAPGFADAAPAPKAHETASAPEPAIQPPAFAFDGIDGLAAQLRSEPGWFDRWGRKAASWSLGLAGAVLLAGAGVWVYNESKLERTLAAVAKSSPQVSDAKPAPAIEALPPASAAVQAPAAAVPPAAPATPLTAPPGAQLVMLNEAPVAPAKDAATPPEGVAVIKETSAAARDVAEVNLKGAKPAKASIKAVRNAKANAPAPVAAAVAPRKAKRDKAEARLAPAAPSEEAEHASQLALTLKQCRIEGYHAQQCLKRGCVLTKYGLACKG